MNPLRVSGSLFQERMSDSEASGKESEDKTSESEEDKSSPAPEERDLNMNQGQPSKNPVGELAENPLSDQLRAVTERITQLVSEAGNSENPKTLQDLAVLQTTLFTLQQQHLLQMQILAHMQNQMKPQQQERQPDSLLSASSLF